MLKKCFLLFVIVSTFIITSCSQSPSTGDSNIPYPEIERIALEDSHTAFEEGTAVFIDVRSAVQFDQGRIPGSINIAGDKLSEHLDELDPEASYITLCT